MKCVCPDTWDCPWCAYMCEECQSIRDSFADPEDHPEDADFYPTKDGEEE